MFAQHSAGKTNQFYGFANSVLDLRKAAGLAVSVCGATVRPKRGLTLEAGALKQKGLISDG
ncbi:hypothetical protein [Okeania sp. SIO1I7]|uniref:hypothetical protein n=1 Tax=Okeania sp. SIO1I7 TaxID=2607772 RepID=UPI0013FCB577|nr:hypothetical protein [Okeania sp. SIO1I7]NET27239.1 hypothetical protein [Okeania sp. SIO1I7]